MNREAHIAVNITIPQHLVFQIERLSASETRYNRSAMISRLLAEALEARGEVQRPTLELFAQAAPARDWGT